MPHSWPEPYREPGVEMDIFADALEIGRGSVRFGVGVGVGVEEGEMDMEVETEIDMDMENATSKIVLASPQTRPTMPSQNQDINTKINEPKPESPQSEDQRAAARRQKVNPYFPTIEQQIAAEARALSTTTPRKPRPSAAASSPSAAAGVLAQAVARVELNDASDDDDEADVSCKERRSRLRVAIPRKPINVPDGLAVVRGVRGVPVCREAYRREMRGLVEAGLERERIGGKGEGEGEEACCAFRGVQR